MADLGKEAQKAKEDLGQVADLLETKPKNILNFVGILACIAVIAVVMFLILR